MSDAHRATVGRYLTKADLKGRKITAPTLEEVREAIAHPIRPHRRRHWLSAAINRLRFRGKQYSKRQP